MFVGRQLINTLIDYGADYDVFDNRRDKTRLTDYRSAEMNFDDVTV